MSKLVARILLAILMIPAAAIFYVVVFVMNERGWNNSTSLFLLSGFITWLFIAVYWTILWIGVVRMSRERVTLSIVAALT